MKRVFVFVTVLFLVAVVGYFFWSIKDKDLKSVPANTDTLVLIDVKELKAQYFLTLIKNPSKWFEASKSSSESNGLEIPDYVQVFHLKDSSFSDWYSVFEISNQNELFGFLNKKGYKLVKNKLYKKDQISVKIEASKCVFGVSNSNFEQSADAILRSKTKKLHADELINNSAASISYFAKSKIHKLAVDLNDDDIEIKTKTTDGDFSKMISDLDQKTSFFKLNLDSDNVKILSKLLNKKLSDSVNVHSISAVSELEMVKDKIVSYSYDDNFNEVEKVSYQQILQPSYSISLETWDAEKTWNYFEGKKWINQQNQFTAIPFQPNVVAKSGNKISIKSSRKEAGFGQIFSGNYVFIKNNPLLVNSIKSFSASEKKVISNIDYCFYSNKNDYYYFNIKFKKEKLPLILRW